MSPLCSLYARCPGERPVRDDGAGGSGLCGSSEREVLHGALLTKTEINSRKSLKGGSLPAF
ncbi:hypothetical protein EGV93_00240 [Pseudomonas aeruginosa]|nr:hypothetical protein EGV93_00240 [Pseudomonas aeruginosa]OPE28317.1 hypothetical protein APB15_31410 [Pseudomonas aeruginosa]OPE38272.1 hypothetical protein APB58_30960 [Pseudomonas aeruginosa]PBL56756.1 hypothetical protein B8B61_03000 [Pseudomonas aeruginosa]PBM13985.1 hypothetical protein B8A58_29155 [Pseudomonas aeruginosa]